MGCLIYRVRFILVVVVLLSGSGSGSANAAKHPLDPLSASEIDLVRTILVDAEHTDDSSRFVYVALHPADKQKVWTWEHGRDFERLATVTVRHAGATFKGIVDLVQEKVRYWAEIPGVQPGMLLTEEWQLAQVVVRRDERWQTAVRRRGIDDITKVVCTPLAIGYFGPTDGAKQRLFKVVCYDASVGTNYWARPIEGLIVTVDMEERVVIDVLDNGADYRSDESAELPDVGVAEQTGDFPDSDALRVDNYSIEWERWRFHVGMDPRVGPIISTVRFTDGEQSRAVLYRAHLSELFVPYMDFDDAWYFRAFLDAGELGIGRLATPLVAGLDCPVNAEFFHAYFADDWGNSYEHQNAVCIFERKPNQLAWRHYEAFGGRQHGEQLTELVVRTIASVGNYDYGFDWIFRRDGSVFVDVAASGIVVVKAVSKKNTGRANVSESHKSGRLIAPGLLGVNHDHFFSFYLDLDVDGPSNVFSRDRIVEVSRDSELGRQSVWTVRSQDLATERSARSRIERRHPTIWRVKSSKHEGRLGHPTSYRLIPGASAASLLRPDSPAGRRGSFVEYDLWVSIYDPAELFAAGEFPNQRKDIDGVAAWTESADSIVDTDIVLWYTLGMHHVVRSEDWPAMAVVRNGFSLVPFDFFDSNQQIPREN